VAEPSLLPPLAASLICATLLGCGGPDAEERLPAPRLSDEELAAVTVRRQMHAVARGDGETACGLLSAKALEEAEAEISRRAGDIGCATAVAQGAGSLPGDVRRALRRPVITRVQIRGGRATVDVRVANRRGGVRLRRIDDRWRVDGLPL